MGVGLGDIRAVMLEYLKRSPEGQFNLIGDKSLHALFQERGFPLQDEDLGRLQQVIHELYLDRIIFLGNSPKGLGDQAWGWPFYRLTEYGKMVVNDREYQPYDPDGYLSRLKKEIPAVDEVVLRYLEEGLTCYRQYLLLAAAVMIGCAAEKVMLLLVDAFGRAISDTKAKEKYEKEIASWLISRKYEALWKRLESLAGQLPSGLGDNLHVILDRVFDLIRTTRNDAGHPTGKQIEREAVYANLLLFPGYSKRVYGLIGYLSKNKV
jgi:hypothetical protein